MYDLDRFVKAQEKMYDIALKNNCFHKVLDQHLIALFHES